MAEDKIELKATRHEYVLENNQGPDRFRVSAEYDYEWNCWHSKITVNGYGNDSAEEAVANLREAAEKFIEMLDNS